jgi:hypothetical protein
MFTDTLNKVAQGYIAHTPLRMIQSLTLKGKDSQAKFKERAEEVPGHRNLLLYMVRLIHADPMLMLNVSLLLKKLQFHLIKLFRIKAKPATKYKVLL